MKFCAKIGSFILGIVIGIVLVFGGVGLGGYLVLTKEGMVGNVAEKVDAFNPSPEIAEKSLLEYGKTVFEAVKKFEETTFGTIEDTVGINITNTLAEALGLEADVLRDSTIGNVAENILDGYTITSLQDKFGITLPDLPMFQDETFRNKPIKDAFNYLSEQLDFDTMTVRQLNEKFGVTLGDLLSQPELLDTPINQLGDKVMTLPLHNFVSITLDVEVDRYLAEHAITKTAVYQDLEHFSLEEWKTGKTAFRLESDRSNLGTDSAYVFDNPADFFASTVYFEDVVNEEGGVSQSAKALQAEWLAAYNQDKEEEDKAVEFWQFAIENKDLYNAIMDGREDVVKEWTRTQWLEKRHYVEETADWTAWYTANTAEGGLAVGKTVLEAKDVYFDTVLWVSTDAEAWKVLNPTGTKDDYKAYLFDGAYQSINYYDYMPSFVAPVAPSVVVTETDGKDAATINQEFVSKVPVASNRTLQYLYYAVVGGDGDDGLNAYMNGMTLNDATEIKDTDHVLLQRLKYEKIANLGTAVTEEVNNMALKELMTIITDAEANYQNGNYVATAEERQAFIDQMGEGNYFETKAEQQEWIDNQTEVYYDRLAWEKDMADQDIRWFETATERQAEYDKFVLANQGTTVTVEEFGIVIEGNVLFAKPYAPEVREGYGALVPSNKMLQAIANSTPSSLNEDIADLTLIDIFGVQNQGAMSLVSGYTKLNNVSTAMTEAMQTSTMGKLIDAGVLKEKSAEHPDGIDFTGLTDDQIALVKNLTIEGMVKAYVDALKGVVTP